MKLNSTQRSFMEIYSVAMNYHLFDYEGDIIVIDCDENFQATRLTHYQLIKNMFQYLSEFVDEEVTEEEIEKDVERLLNHNMYGSTHPFYKCLNCDDVVDIDFEGEGTGDLSCPKCDYSALMAISTDDYIDERFNEFAEADWGNIADFFLYYQFDAINEYTFVKNKCRVKIINDSLSKEMEVTYFGQTVPVRSFSEILKLVKSDCIDPDYGFMLAITQYPESDTVFIYGSGKELAWYDDIQQFDDEIEYLIKDGEAQAVFDYYNNQCFEEINDLGYYSNDEKMYIYWNEYELGNNTTYNDDMDYYNIAMIGTWEEAIEISKQPNVNPRYLYVKPTSEVVWKKGYHKIKTIKTKKGRVVCVK